MVPSKSTERSVLSSVLLLGITVPFFCTFLLYFYWVLLYLSSVLSSVLSLDTTVLSSVIPSVISVVISVLFRLSDHCAKRPYVRRRVKNLMSRESKT